MLSRCVTPYVLCLSYYWQCCHNYITSHRGTCKIHNTMRNTQTIDLKDGGSKTIFTELNDMLFWKRGCVDLWPGMQARNSSSTGLFEYDPAAALHSECVTTCDMNDIVWAEWWCLSWLTNTRLLGRNQEIPSEKKRLTRTDSRIHTECTIDIKDTVNTAVKTYLTINLAP